MEDLLIQQVFTERLLCTKPVSRHRGYSEQYKHNTYRSGDVQTKKISKMCAMLERENWNVVRKVVVI